MYHICLAILLISELCAGQTKRPPTVVTKPNLLDSFIPASMQIIAHITELMKYDLKPTTGTTTTTMRPTSSHRPAIFAPAKPPGPEAYFAKGFTYEEYVERLRYPSGYNYFDRYKFPVEEEDYGRSLGDEVPQNIDIILGKSFSDLLRLANRIEDVEEGEDRDVQVQKFSQEYDDSDLRYLLAREKKKPPTRAYVSLLSLYDLLNKESKKLGLNKYNGYAQNVLNDLAEMSTGTSAYQLRSVLAKIVQRRDTKDAKIIRRINELVKDLDESSSYISAALRHIPPLPYSL